MKKISENLLKILVCPKCKGELTCTNRDHQLLCSSCNLSYPIKNGIPIMIVDEATPTDKSDS